MDQNEIFNLKYNTWIHSAYREFNMRIFIRKKNVSGIISRIVAHFYLAYNVSSTIFQF